MVAAVALMALVSCNKEEINNNVVEQPQEEPTVIVEFEAGFDVETKTALDADGKKTVWKSDDSISINGQEFKVSEIKEDGKAIFVNVNNLPSDFAAPFTAIYPYGSDGSVPAEQDAVAGNFDPKAVIEKATSDNYSLSFKNETSLLKFQVEAACDAVTLSSDDDLATGSKTVTINGDFKTGETYYVAVLPGTKKNFVVRIDGYLSRNAASVTINRSTIANMKTLPEPVVSDWGIVGATNGWNEKSPITMYEDLNGCLLVRGFSGGEFKFVKSKTWNISRGIRSREASPVKGTWNLCGTKNISLSNGEYDVYFNPKNGVFNFVDNGANVDNYLPTGKAIYLQVKDWSNSDAYFEAWVWGSSQADAWYKFAMAGEKDNNHYVVYVPNDATGMKILRKDPKSASQSWASWNDSGDQTIPSGNNMFIESGWGKYSWGSYTE